MDLTNYIDNFVEENCGEVTISDTAYHFFNLGKKNAEEQMMKDATECEVKVDAGGYPYIDRCIELYDYDKDIPLAKEGDKVKIVVIKGE